MNINRSVSAATQVVMLKDAKGYTRHEAVPPVLIECKEGDEPVVSADLATLWLASKTCELRKPSAEERASFAAAAGRVVEEQKVESARVKEVKAAAAAKREKSGVVLVKKKGRPTGSKNRAKGL